MATLKNSFKDISGDTESIIRDYLKLFSIKQTEKLAMLLGVLLSVFVLSILLLIVIVFASFALAEYLNSLFVSDFLGYVIIVGFYVLIVLFLIIRMLSKRTPLFTNKLIKFLVFLFDIDLKNKSNLDGLKMESATIVNEIDKSKIKLSSNIVLLRYVMYETFFREFFGLFTSKKKTDEEKESDSTGDKEKPDNKED